MSSPRTCPQCGAPLPASSPAEGPTAGLCPKCLLRRGLETNTQGPTGQPAAAWTPPTLEQLAATFPELDLLAFIGRGGMGAVYRARQKSLDRIVALKILPPEIGRDPAFAERFAREAQAMARLSHPHIVTIHDFGQRDGVFFFVMEYVDGLSLRQLLDAGSVAPKEALAIVPQICEALQYAHDRGIVHRDIKPENILLNRQGQVKIADFGLAKLMGMSGPSETAGTPAAAAGGPTQTLADRIMGTPQYMAPEQTQRPAEVDHRADIYSLGVVFYQMLTGELPTQTLEPPSRKVTIDVRLDEVVLRALAKEPDRRYQHASEVKTQVETIATTPASVPMAQPGAVAPTAAPEGPGKSGMVRSPAEAMPRFSRTAILGAAWATLFFAVVPAFIAHDIQTQEFWQHGPFASPLMTLIFFVFILPAFVAPFGATICGGIAIAQIRRSHGRLYGLPLALFDMLVYPLLAIDALLIWWIYLLIDGLARHAHPEGGAANVDGVLSIAIPVCLVVDVVIAWLAWRAVKNSDGATITTGGRAQDGGGTPAATANIVPPPPVPPAPPARPAPIRSARGPLAILGLFYAAYLALITSTAGMLPARVATHFGAQGAPNGWMSRGLYLAFIAGLPVALTALFWLVGKLIGRLPAWAINMPRRDYWLAPQRRARTTVLVQRYLWGLVCIFLVFFGGLHVLTLAANDVQPPYLPMGGLLLLTIGFMLALIVWITHFMMRFAEAEGDSPPPSPKGPLLSRQGFGPWDYLPYAVLTALVIGGVMWLLERIGLKMPGPLLYLVPIALFVVTWLVFRDLQQRVARGGGPLPWWKRWWVHLAIVVLVVLVVRLVALEALVVSSQSMDPELPLGSRVLVWKLGRTYSPGDLIAYHAGAHIQVARVLQSTPDAIHVHRNTEPDTTIPPSVVIGKVISVYWRAPASTTAPASATAPAATPPRFQVHLVLTAADKAGPSDQIANPSDPDHPLRLARPVLLDESAISSATLERQDGRTILYLRFTVDGSTRFHQITAKYQQRTLAFLLDGQLLAAPTIATPITSPGASLQLPREPDAALRQIVATLNAIASTAPAATTTAPAEIATATAAFAPVIETIVRVPEAPDYVWTDLDTGKGHSTANWPANADINDNDKGLAWRLRTGAEAGAGYGDGTHGQPTGPFILAWDTRVMAVPSSAWDELSPQEVQRMVGLAPEVAVQAGVASRAVLSLAVDKGFPATYLFQTRQGVGMLQLLGVSDKPRGINVRIRPVLPAATQPASTTAPAETTTAPASQPATTLTPDATTSFAVRDGLVQMQAGTRTATAPSFRVVLPGSCGECVVEIVDGLLRVRGPGGESFMADRFEVAPDGTFSMKGATNVRSAASRPVVKLNRIFVLHAALENGEPVVVAEDLKAESTLRDRSIQFSAPIRPAMRRVVRMNMTDALYKGVDTGPQAGTAWKSKDGRSSLRIKAALSGKEPVLLVNDNMQTTGKLVLEIETPFNEPKDLQIETEPGHKTFQPTAAVTAPAATRP